jgi:hypothetical protein
MSAGNVVTQIRRNAGCHDFIPAYSTAQLMWGVCHLTHVPQKDLDRLSREEKLRLSREKFEENKEQIYMLLAQGRAVKAVATQFRIGYEALQRYLEDERK